MPDPSRTYALAAFCAAANTSRADVVPATVLRILGSEFHPSRVHGLKHFFGRSGVALRDAELLERFRPPCTRDCKRFHVKRQDVTQLLGDFIRADHRTQRPGGIGDYCARYGDFYRRIVAEPTGSESMGS